MNTVIRILLPIGIIVIAILIGKFFISLKPKEQSQTPPEVVLQVDTITVSLGNHNPVINTFGTIQSYFETQLTPEVNGKITSVAGNFRVGEMVARGEVLATIDDADYLSALATQKANLTLQQSALAEEEIRAKQAIADWKASGRDLSKASDFLLRKPQLAAARANVVVAETAIDLAKTNLKRTQIRVPYDAIVTSRSASLGNYATAQTSLGTLIATEKAEVRIPLTAEQLTRISNNKNRKKTVTLTSPSLPYLKRVAELSRMERVIDPQSQVSYGIVTIDKPYSGDKQNLPVGSFVNIAIPAAEIKNAYKIPESALVNDQYLWALDDENHLLRLSGKRIQSESGFAFVRINSKKSESVLKIVSRPLSTFRIGMKVAANTKSNKPE